MSSKILPCACENPFQEKAYGHHMRLHNKTMKKSGALFQYRCSSCLAMHTGPDESMRKFK